MKTANWMAAGALLTSLHSPAFDLSGTPIQLAADRKGLDPILLYSVALAESARKVSEQNIAPWPWTIRTLHKPYYLPSQEKAKQKLNQIIEEEGPKASVDIGYLQVNWYWHGHRVDQPTDLLDLDTNLTVGAAILKESIDSAPGDLALGVGRYHNWSDADLARAYGRKVLAIYENLIDISSEDRYAANINN